MASPTSDQSDAEAPGAAAEIRRHLACVGCGYDLHGLPSAGRCPECGTPVGETDVPNQLRFANRVWLAQIQRGVTRIQRSCIAVFVGVFFGLLLAVFAGPGAAWLAALGVVLMLATVLAGLCLFGWGLFSVTAPEPRESYTEATWSGRRRLRAAAIVTVCLFFSESMLHYAPPVAGLLVPLATVSFYVAVSYLIYGLCGRLRALALRIPDAVLARSMRRFERTILILVATLLVLWLADALMAGLTAGVAGAGPPAAPRRGILGTMKSCMGFVVPLVLFFGCYGRVSTFRAALRKELAGASDPIHDSG